MASTVLTPFTWSAGQRTGKLWRKRVLPVGDIDYKGRTLHFTRGYNDALAEAFASGAYDQVPFQLADGGNTHTNDPDRFRGDVVNMESGDDGLWITLAPTPAGEQVLESNPHLGVSARIVEDYARSDGRVYPAAVQHVLGTLDPRIPGLGPWRQVEMSNPSEQVLDLSGYEFTEPSGGSSMPDAPDLTDPASAAKLAALLSIPADQLSRLAATLPQLSDEDLADLNGGAPLDGEEALDDISDEELAQIIASLPPEELAALEAEYAGQLAGAGAATGLTAEGYAALELANSQAAENARELAVLRGQYDSAQFDAEKRRFAHDVGVPPYIVDLARPLLEGSGRTVELANGDLADAGQIMRAVLTEFGRAARMLDLDVELGSPMDEPEAGTEARTQRDDLVTRFRGQTGI